MRTPPFLIRPLDPGGPDHPPQFLVTTKRNTEQLMADPVFRRALNRDIASKLRCPIEKVKQAPWLCLEITNDPDAVTCVPGYPEGSLTDLDVEQAIVELHALAQLQETDAYSFGKCLCGEGAILIVAFRFLHKHADRVRRVKSDTLWVGAFAKQSGLLCT
jgi:hypothetical protein